MSSRNNIGRTYEDIRRWMWTKTATAVEKTPDGFRVIYHGTCVYERNGTLEVLNSGGWRTSTTKNRINDCLLFGRVRQVNGEWEYYSEQDKDSPFIDGMLIDEGYALVDATGEQKVIA